MPRYKIPVGEALNFTRSGLFKRELHGAIKSFNHDHPEHQIPSKVAVSLVKRVSGQLRETFARMYADRIMLTWLEEHRSEWPELCKIQGGLRQVILDEMKRREENNTQDK